MLGGFCALGMHYTPIERQQSVTESTLNKIFLLMFRLRIIVILNSYTEPVKLALFKTSDIWYADIC